MTRVLALGMLGLVVVMAVLNSERLETYTKQDTATTTVETIEVLPDWAQDEDARKAAEDVLRKKELEAELEVLENEVQERQTRIDVIREELLAH